MKSAEHEQEPPTKHPEPAAGANQPLALSDSPRHRVLAAYARFESLASAAGLERADWETALSHPRRVAAARGLDDRAVKELTHLYYRARFSQADIEEIAADRAQKLDASLQAGLRPG